MADDPVPDLATIQELVCAQAKIAPSAAAILAPGREGALTYGGLARQIDYTRKALNRAGIGRGDRVAVVIDNGPEMATAFVGIASVAVCAPLNPSYTRDELEFYLSDLGVAAVVVPADKATPAREIAGAMDLKVISLEVGERDLPGLFRLSGEKSASAAPSEAPPAADDVALILHTSGTTSRPKIVPIRHRNITISAANIVSSLALAGDDRCLNVMPLFHIHGLVCAVLASLRAGAGVVCSPGFHLANFFDWLDKFKPSWYTAVPTMHQAVLSRAHEHTGTVSQATLRFVRSSSAALPPTTLQALSDLFGCPVIEAYGMTEGAHQIASNPLTSGAVKPGTVGLAAGSEVAIMNEDGAVLTQGETGEIVIRGANVVDGYENNPDANASSFTDGWFRTGDQGWIDEQGYITISGRLKEIINRGGEKISPREVDEALSKHPAVAVAVAFAVPHPTLGEEVGAAIVLKSGEMATVASIRAHARQHLAYYKVPRHVVIVAEIPKGPTGKLQRIGLAEKLGITSGGAKKGTASLGFERSQSPLMAAVTGLWMRALGRDQIEPEEDFFELGGDSLQLVELATEVSQCFGVDFPLETAFGTASTISGMVAEIENRRGAGATPSPQTIPVMSRDDPAPASFEQEAFWIGARIFRGEPIYNMASAIRLEGALDHEALEQALAAVLERHDILRTVLKMEDGALVQEILSAEPVQLSPLAVAGTTATEREANAIVAARSTVQSPFDMSGSPPVRLTLLRLSERDHILVATIHHSTADGWSRNIFFSDLLMSYDRIVTGEGKVPAAHGIRYGDYARWQRRRWDDGGFAGNLEYWRRHMEDEPEALALSEGGADADWHGGARTFTLSPDQTDSLCALSRGRQGTLYMTLLAVFHLLVQRHTGQRDSVIGTLMANRALAEIRNVIGCFSRILPFRMRLEGDPTFFELLDQVRATTLGAYPHQGMPPSKLISELRPGLMQNLGSPFPVWFQLRNFAAVAARHIDGLSVRPFEFDSGICEADLHASFIETEESLTGTFAYKTGLFDEAEIARLADEYKGLLEAVTKSPERPISRLSRA